MKSPLSFVVLSLSLAAILVLAIIGDIPYWVWYFPVGIAIMAAMALFRGSYLPQNAVARGMELIQTQDYNNRLVKVGEANADRIVELFNSLIDKLRAERLQNREQESLMKLLIEASPMGVVMLDFNNNISMANVSFLKIFGLKSLDEIRGKRLSDINDDLVPEIRKVALGKSEIIRRGNFRIYRVYHLNFIRQGFPREFYLLESLTEEIMKAEKSAYEQVIRTISHEVNNTMGGIRSVLEIVAETVSDTDIRKVAESCGRRCDSMSDFIREYAEVVKLPDPVLKPFDLSREIELLKPFLKSIVPEGIDLRYEPKSNHTVVEGDAGLLQQVLVNIVKNAVESFKKDRGENNGRFVEIEVEKTAGGVLLTISNNGEAIIPETASQLFTPFFTTKPEGKGIGLTLVREVLSRHSAEYNLSTGEDGITRFSILFK